MRDHKERYKKLAKKYNMPESTIAKIVDSQFEFTKNIIQDGNDEQVRLQYLGKFHVPPNWRDVIDKRVKRMKDAREQGD